MGLENGMSADYIRERLRKRWHAGTQQPLNGKKRAAVLVPLFCSNDEWNLLLTHRTQSVETHKGQVAFPGGAEEIEDGVPEQTALRETCEEIGVGKDRVEILGRMGEFPTPGFLVTPVVGVIQWPVPLTISSAEVSRVFSVPYGWLADQRNWEERPYPQPDGGFAQVIFYHDYEGEKVWGVTARIIHDLVRTLT
ncbi:MAG TPA: CoA pyrophosphatase, partial [Longilinea sp.]|nr:CoA pyrophosphatase [Longilinea sp.]